MKREILKNQNQLSAQMDVNPSDAALFINGMYFDMDFTDIYTLLDHIRTEDRVMGGLYKLGKFALSHLCSLFVCLILKIYIFIHFNQFSFFFLLLLLLCIFTRCLFSS